MNDFTNNFRATILRFKCILQLTPKTTVFPFYESHGLVNLTVRNESLTTTNSYYSGTDASIASSVNGKYVSDKRLRSESTPKPVLKMSLGAIVGVTVGVLLMFSIAVVSVFFIKRRAQRNKEQKKLITNKQSKQLQHKEVKRAFTKTGPTPSILKFTNPDQVVCNTVSRDTFETGMHSLTSNQGKQEVL